MTLKYTNGMTIENVQNWLNYWRNANMVHLGAITTLQNVAVARRFCSCMRTGVFADVSDGQIWDALRDMREREKSAAKSA